MYHGHQRIWSDEFSHEFARTVILEHIKPTVAVNPTLVPTVDTCTFWLETPELKTLKGFPHMLAI